jgi:hypothetical protein
MVQQTKTMPNNAKKRADNHSTEKGRTLAADHIAALSDPHSLSINGKHAVATATSICIET